MIKVAGTDPNGERFVLLVLEPGNLDRLQAGEPITVALRQMLSDALAHDVTLVLEFAEDIHARGRELVLQANADGARVHVIPRGPTREQ